MFVAAYLEWWNNRSVPSRPCVQSEEGISWFRGCFLEVGFIQGRPPAVTHSYRMSCRYSLCPKYSCCDSVSITSPVLGVRSSLLLQL